MTTIAWEELVDDPYAFLDKVEAGEVIEVTRKGVPFLRMEPVQPALLDVTG